MIVHCIHDADRKDRFKLLQKEIEEQKFEVRIWPAIKAEKPKIGISLAHKQIVRWAKEENLEEVIVMEDDCHWVVPGAFEYFLNKKPSAYDLYLSSIMWGKIRPDNSVDDYAGNQCYFIHRRFYDTFLESHPLKDIDRAVARKGRFIVCQPFASIQHETVSGNRVKKIHRNIKFYRKRTFFNGTNG